MSVPKSAALGVEHECSGEPLLIMLTLAAESVNGLNTDGAIGLDTLMTTLSDSTISLSDGALHEQQLSF